MAKENAFYFTHDFNTRNDSKIKNLLSVHGFLGYGLFWAIIEDLYNNANALPLNCKVIAFDLRTKEKTIHSIIHDFDLFVIEKNIFGSRSVQRRLEDRDAKSIKARESAFKRWNNDANAKQPQSKPNAIKERKGKESKKNKENKENSKEFAPPILNEVIDYFKENNYTEIAAKKAFEFYSVANWHDSNGKPVKNWKQKMLSIWFKPENLIKKPNEVPVFNKQQEFAMKIAGPMNTFMGRCEAYKINHPGELPPQEWYDKFNKENGTDLKPK